MSLLSLNVIVNVNFVIVVIVVILVTIIGLIVMVVVVIIVMVIVVFVCCDLVQLLEHSQNFIAQTRKSRAKHDDHNIKNNSNDETAAI